MQRLVWGLFGLLVLVTLSCTSPATSPERAADGARIERAPQGERYAVYEADRFTLYEPDGARLGAIEAPPPGLRHKLIGEGNRVLAPVAELRGEETRVLALRVLDTAGAVLAEWPSEDLRFTQLSDTRVLAAFPARIESRGYDGALHWTAPIFAHALATARRADAALAIDGKDTRRVFHLREGRVVRRTELRAPIWNLALAPEGARSAVTTERRLHVFEDGVLRSSIALPVRYAVSLAVADDGRVLVGGQDERQNAVALCYAPGGALLARLDMGHETHAYKPRVRFGEGDAFRAETSGGVVTLGECPESTP